MFKLNPNPTFTAKITIPVPGGKAQPLTFKFKRLGRKALRDMFAAMEKSRDEKVSESEELEMLMTFIDGWEDVDAEFSEEALGVLCDNFPGAIGAIIQGYTEKMFGAAEKN